MPVTILGSGTLVPSGTAHSAAHLIEVPGTMILLDVGPGTVHGLGRDGRPWWNVTHVFLSHYHTDHIGDLPHLLFALTWALPEPRKRPLDIIGPPGLRERIGHLEAVHGSFIRDPGFPVRYHEVLREAEWEGPTFSVRIRPTCHTERSVAYRFQGDGWSVGYTGDTGPDPELGDELSDCDVLICECAYSDPPVGPMHLSPTSVADIARRARPRSLVLTHLYAPLTPETVVELVRTAGYEGPVVGGTDGLSLPLPADEGVPIR